VCCEKRAFQEQGSGGYCVRLKRTGQGYLRHLETGFLLKNYKGKKDYAEDSPFLLFYYDNTSCGVKLHRIIENEGIEKIFNG